VPRYAYKGKMPRVHSTAFVAPDAILIGDVEIGEDASVFFGCVLRGDEDRIVVGARSNIQDGATLHTEPGEPVIIGEDVTVGHMALVHSALIERNVLIGQAAVLVGGNSVGAETIIGAGAVVPRGMKVPGRSLVVGVPAKVVREIRPDDARWTVDAADHYVERAAYYRENLTEIE